jgi:hypothetical protein
LVQFQSLFLEEDLHWEHLDILLNLVHQELVELKVEVETLDLVVLELHSQEVLEQPQQQDGDMQALILPQQTNLVAVVVALVVLVIQVLKVEQVFSYQQYSGIQMDSNMIIIQTIHLDLVHLLVGL